MPHYDPPNALDLSILRAEFRHNSDVSQLLYEVLRHIERVTGPHMPTALKEFSPELQQWWAEHQQHDQHRRSV